MNEPILPVFVTQPQDRIDSALAVKAGVQVVYEGRFEYLGWGRNRSNCGLTILRNQTGEAVAIAHWDKYASGTSITNDTEGVCASVVNLEGELKTRVYSLA